DLRHDLEVRLEVKENGEGAAHHGLVLGQQHPDHKPPPGRVATRRNPSVFGSTTNAPPAETTRSRSPSSPPVRIAGVEGPPTPSSAMVSAIRPSSSVRTIRHALAAEWRSTLVAPSRTTQASTSSAAAD